MGRLRITPGIGALGGPPTSALTYAAFASWRSITTMAR
jgi:hypothetical protein